MIQHVKNAQSFLVLHHMIQQTELQICRGLCFNVYLMSALEVTWNCCLLCLNRSIWDTFEYPTVSYSIREWNRSEYVVCNLVINACSRIPVARLIKHETKGNNISNWRRYFPSNIPFVLVVLNSPFKSGDVSLLEELTFRFWPLPSFSI